MCGVTQSAGIHIRFGPSDYEAPLREKPPITRKQAQERDVSLSFASLSGLPISEDLVVAADPPGPDIRCEIQDRGIHLY
jgi:hypothetical protein